MRKEIIQTEDYLLLVSDEVIRPCKNPGKCMSHFSKPCDDCGKYQGRTVIAHLPLNNSPELEGIPLLPKIEDNVEKLAIQYVDLTLKPYINCKNYSQKERISLYGGAIEGFKEGYKKAKETYKYTEEDLLQFAEKYRKIKDGNVFEGLNKLVSEYNKQKQSKYPIAFRCDTYKVVDIQECEEYYKPKTKINSQNKEELVGTYIWES